MNIRISACSPLLRRTAVLAVRNRALDCGNLGRRWPYFPYDAGFAVMQTAHSEDHLSCRSALISLGQMIVLTSGARSFSLYLAGSWDDVWGSPCEAEALQGGSVFLYDAGSYGGAGVGFLVLLPFFIGYPRFPQILACNYR
jgi:hypothetical protein